MVSCQCYSAFAWRFNKPASSSATRKVNFGSYFTEPSHGSSAAEHTLPHEPVRLTWSHFIYRSLCNTCGDKRNALPQNAVSLPCCITTSLVFSICCPYVCEAVESWTPSGCNYSSFDSLCASWLCSHQNRRFRCPESTEAIPRMASEIREQRIMSCNTLFKDVLKKR